MAGGKARPKKDKAVKVSAGQVVKTGEILSRGIPTYKAGAHTQGMGCITALCAGKVYFTKKKTPHGRVRTFINVLPLKNSR